MSTIQQLASQGRGGDAMIAHLTPGDVVIPAAVAQKDPAILTRLKKNFEDAGQDYRSHIAGTEYNSINPETGMPEFKFGGGWLKPLATIAGTAFGGPLGAALASGGVSLVQGEGLKGALSSGASAGIGSALGGLAAGGFGGISGSGGGMSSILGLLSGGLTSSQGAVDNGKGGYVPAQAEENLNISRPEEMALPSSLSRFSGLDPLQRTTNIATEGTQGQGASPEARDYFLNQVQRRLTDTQPGSTMPVEDQYLSKLGVNYTPGDTKSILEGIARNKLLKT